MWPPPTYPPDGPTAVELEALQDLVKRYAGLRVDATKLRFSLERAWPALAAQGVPDVKALVNELSFLAGRLWLVFLPYVTINETYFMREQPQLDEFIRTALPELAARARGRGDTGLRLLSAACSTGEEAYSLAILLAGANVAGRVVGVDIDPQAIERAEAGMYGANAFRGTSEAWRLAHFDALPDGQWWVKDTYRAMASFRRVNLLAAEQVLGSQRFDAIFCRNVLIYFDRPTQLEVIAQLGRLLVPGGFLCLGHSEMFFGVNLGLAPHVTSHATMYQREVAS
jgi:chemotaxis protein methyltransferase CheR